MWNKIIKICEQVLDTHKQSNWSKLVPQLTLQLVAHYENHSLNLTLVNEIIPYGRYLLYSDLQKRFHMEMHVFSHDYIGEIHCHDTWGIFWLISGSLFVENFFYHQNQAKLTCSALVKRGSAFNFHPPESDWHRVRTVGKKEQTLSLHIYGSGYDLQYGKYLNQDGQLIKSERGNFKENSLFSPHIIEK